jgi:hypothetical protein
MPTSTLKGVTLRIYIYTMVQLQKNNNILPTFFLSFKKKRTMTYLRAPRKVTGEQALTNEQNGTTSLDNSNGSAYRKENDD